MRAKWVTIVPCQFRREWKLIKGEYKGPHRVGQHVNSMQLGPRRGFVLPVVGTKACKGHSLPNHVDWMWMIDALHHWTILTRSLWKASAEISMELPKNKVWTCPSWFWTLPIMTAFSTLAHLTYITKLWLSGPRLKHQIQSRNSLNTIRWEA